MADSIGRFLRGGKGVPLPRPSPRSGTDISPHLQDPRDWTERLPQALSEKSLPGAIHPESLPGMADSPKDPNVINPDKNLNTLRMRGKRLGLTKEDI